MKSNKLLSAIVIITAGNLTGQIFNALTIPVITRLYEVEDIGKFGVIQSLAIILSALFTLKLELLVPMIEEVRIKYLSSILNLIQTTLLFTVLVLSICCIVIVGYSDNLIIRYGMYITVLASAIGFSEFYRYYAIREKRFRSIAHGTFLKTGLSGVLQVFFGLITNSIFSLLLPQLIAIFLSAMRYIGEWRSAKKILFQEKISKYSRKKILVMLRINRNYITTITPLSLLNLTNNLIIPALIASMFSFETAAKFTLAQRLVGLPALLVGRSIGDVYFGEFAELIKNKKSGALGLLSSGMLKIGIAVILISILVYLMPTILYQKIFGDSWGDLKYTVDYLWLLSGIQLLVSPFSQVLIMLKQEKKLFLWDLGRFISIAVIFVSTALFNYKYISTIEIYTTLMIGFYLYLIYLLFKVLKLNERKQID